MRTIILIDKDGNYVNSKPVLNVNPLLSLFFNQVSLEFYNGITDTVCGKVADESTLITTGLSGNVDFAPKPSTNTPYPVTIGDSGGIIDISSVSTTQWTGMTNDIGVTCTAVTGCNYIKIILEQS